MNSLFKTFQFRGHVASLVIPLEKNKECVTLIIYRLFYFSIKWWFLDQLTMWACSLCYNSSRCVLKISLLYISYSWIRVFLNKEKSILNSKILKKYTLQVKSLLTPKPNEILLSWFFFRTLSAILQVCVVRWHLWLDRGLL